MNSLSKCNIWTFAFRIAKALLIFCTLLPCSALQAFAQELAGARQVFDGTMLPGVEVATFSHSDTLFPVNIVPVAERRKSLKNRRCHW